ncbi:MAG: hypothetical protein ACLTWM_04855 [Collinsella bouchesdurhonensis]
MDGWFDEAGEKVGSDPTFVPDKGVDLKFVEATYGAAFATTSTNPAFSYNRLMTTAPSSSKMEGPSYSSTSISKAS